MWFYLRVDMACWPCTQCHFSGCSEYVILLFVLCHCYLTYILSSNLKMKGHSFSDYRGTLVDSNQIAHVSHWTIWLHHILLQQLYIARFHHQHKSSFHPGAHHISSLLLWVGSLWKYLNLIVFILFAVVLTCATVLVTFWEKSDRNRLVVNFRNISFFLFLLSLYLQIHIILTQFLQFIYFLFLFYNLWTWSQPNPLNPYLFTRREFQSPVVREQQQDPQI